ncbi:MULTISPECIES: ABC transporter ATP-binding protein [Aneurinibacillus]|uniref:ABC transporter ATP-binding protein n=1 Tax=Aneurinibacillus thermoaerophilus TaxID=143495 RepID=A0ABX8YEW2_ANETH|nr:MULTISPECIES: ABC transporter ATP-binding protein [Aneurinibacillus]AMA73361.1 ABC transporter [Aneurinibacillus sp. XH2]MED0676020.1 ABC transporter ATP-binding protein [Aneurinibacillus thermoaerophilus]MED0680566.1 ABC transporter ATP-binding protein [Aneurinibacillus thermoaerophilus]MED0736303.1 ABC transporter ATP-binding protein [Aneurinibacillus thermoaerophilus]MED0758042.1 ABC transporter ATP-binding protein [Aneurinibacillus thermoaerophilus]
MKTLETENLTLAYGERIIINELNMTIPEGKVTVFIGSNGCGKSTLLRSLARLLKPKSGSVLLDGHSISRLSTKEVARRLAILPQSTAAPEGLTVLQLVKQGRYPYQSWLRQWSEEDEKMVTWALDATQMSELAEQPVDSLSGGQRQRAWIAMVLAQGTHTLLLDEPTTYLDMTHQLEVLDILAELNRNEKRTVVMVLHDLNLACRYADHIVAVQNQTVYAEGAPESVMTEDLVRAVFNLDCRIIKDPIYGTPMCIPYSKHERKRNAG